VLLIVAVEHAIFILREVLAEFIPDVSKKVLRDEAKRVYVVDQAYNQIRNKKQISAGVTYEERLKDEIRA